MKNGTENVEREGTGWSGEREKGKKRQKEGKRLLSKSNLDNKKGGNAEN